MNKEAPTAKELPRENLGHLFLERTRLDKRDIARTLDDYTKCFGFDENYLKGKLILDIGSGKANFAKEANLKGIDVISVDPIYDQEKGKDFFKKLSQEQIENMQNCLVAFPTEGNDLSCFPSGYFDIITSLCSNYLYARDPDEIRENLDENLRVLKNKGELFIFPITITFPEKPFLVFKNHTDYQMIDNDWLRNSKIKLMNVLDHTIDNQNEIQEAFSTVLTENIAKINFFCLPDYKGRGLFSLKITKL